MLKLFLLMTLLYGCEETELESLDSVFVRTEQKKPTFELTTELTVSRKVYDYFLGQNTSLDF